MPNINKGTGILHVNIYNVKQIKKKKIHQNKYVIEMCNISFFQLFIELFYS